MVKIQVKERTKKTLLKIDLIFWEEIFIKGLVLIDIDLIHQTTLHLNIETTDVLKDKGYSGTVHLKAEKTKDWILMHDI